jgi:hypothetical protein
LGEAVKELAPLKLRAKNYPVMLALLLATIIAGASLPAPIDVLRERYSQYRSAIESFTSNKPFDEVVYQVFSYNAYTLLALSAPLLGPLFAAYVAFSTGLTIRAVAYMEAKSVPILLLSFLTTPSTWLYLLAYAIALTESAWLSFTLLQRRPLTLETTLALLTLAAALLLLSATLEATLALSRATPPG